MVLSLTSDLAAFATGGVYVVDGGADRPLTPSG
jgi:hypothetical protein